MSVDIGCVWCCIYAMAWIADCESVNMTMLFTHGGLGLSQSLEMVCNAEPIAFISASELLQCCPHASLLCWRIASGYWMVTPYHACSTHFEPTHRPRHASLWTRRVDGLSCQAFQHVRWVCFASTLRNEVWAQGWLICCSVEGLWS